MKLRQYQREAVDQILSDIEFDGLEMVCLDAFVSYGKSLTICQLSIEMRGRVVILINYSALIDQFVETFKQIGYTDFTVMKAGHEMTFDKEKKIAIVQSHTLFNRLDKHGDMRADYMIVDEAHTYMHGDMFKSIKSRLKPMSVIGMTGTPYDAYGRELKGVENTISTISVENLIEDKYIVDVVQLVPKWTSEISLSGIAKNGNDYSQNELDTVFGTSAYINKVCDTFDSLKETDNIDFNPKEDKSIWFCTTTETCDNFAKELQSRGYNIFSYHTRTPKKLKDKLMHSFRTNEPMQIEDEVNLFNYQDGIKTVDVHGLISIQSLSIGFSVSDIKLCVMTSLSLKRSLTVQQTGRVARAYPGKEIAYMLDCGLRTKHHGIVMQTYEPAKEDSSPKELNSHKKSYSMEHIGEFLGDEINIIDRNWYENEVAKVLCDNRRFSEMPLNELSTRFSIDENIENLIGIAMAFMFQLHGDPYSAESFDVKSQKTKFKKVNNYYNARALSWISEPWIELFSDYSDDTMLISKFTKAFRTKARSIVNNKKNIYGIRFFADFLRNNVLKEKLEDGYFYLYHNIKSGEVFDKMIPEESGEGVLVEWEEYISMKDAYNLSFEIVEVADIQDSALEYEIEISEMIDGDEVTF